MPEFKTTFKWNWSKFIVFFIITAIISIPVFIGSLYVLGINLKDFINSSNFFTILLVIVAISFFCSLFFQFTSAMSVIVSDDKILFKKGKKIYKEVIFDGNIISGRTNKVTGSILKSGVFRYITVKKNNNVKKPQMLLCYNFNQDDFATMMALIQTKAKVYYSKKNEKIENESPIENLAEEENKSSENFTPDIFLENDNNISEILIRKFQVPKNKINKGSFRNKDLISNIILLGKFEVVFIFLLIGLIVFKNSINTLDLIIYSLIQVIPIGFLLFKVFKIFKHILIMKKETPETISVFSNKIEIDGTQFLFSDLAGIVVSPPSYELDYFDEDRYFKIIFNQNINEVVTYRFGTFGDEKSISKTSFKEYEEVIDLIKKNISDKSILMFNL